VQAKKPHMLLEYSFQVNGYVHTGLGRGDVGSPSFYESSVGDRVLIHYLPNDPDINCLQDPDKLFRAEIVPVLSVVLLFPTVIVSVLAFRLGNIMRRNTA
jgi:hypothetical protein